MSEQSTAQAEEKNWIWTDGLDLPLEGRAYASPDEATTPYDRLPKARKDVIPPAVWGLQQHFLWLLKGQIYTFLQTAVTEILKSPWKKRQ